MGVRISSRGRVSAGPVAWLVLTLLGFCAVLLVLGWPMALTARHGHATVLGWCLEALWLLVLVLAAAVVPRASRSAKRKRR